MTQVLHDEPVGLGNVSLSGRGRPGCGRLVVARSRDRSVVCRAFATSPLRLLTPSNHGHAAWIFTSSYGGGLVDGDAIAMQTTVGADACAFVSTQASTKVYRSPHGTRAEMVGEVCDNGLLILTPDPVVCFAQSRYHQVQRFNLAVGAGLVLLDWVSSGRRESGERWAFDEYVSRTTVRVGGRLLVHDALALRASDGDLAGRLGDYDVLAMALVIGASLESEAAHIVAKVGDQPVRQRSERLLAAAPLEGGGCVLRVAGRSVEDVSYALRGFLDFVPALLGDNPWVRKW